MLKSLEKLLSPEWMLTGKLSKNIQVTNNCELNCLEDNEDVMLEGIKEKK